MSDYQKGYNARQDGEDVNFSKSSDWLCGWYAAEADIDQGVGRQEGFICKYCGESSDTDPSDQEQPVDYCQAFNHKHY